MYWDCTPGEERYYGGVAGDQGPWKNLRAYISGLINAGRSRLPTGLREEHKNRCASRPFQGSTAEHRELLQTAQDLLQTLAANGPSIRENATPTLLHPDLHMSNIFVDPSDPTKITGIIDWQSTSIEPAFSSFLPVLHFAIPPQYIPDYEEREAEGKVTARQYWDTALDVCTQGNDRLAPRREIDDDILRPYHYCHRTWKDGLPAAARELNVLLDRWQALGLPGDPPCDAIARDRLRSFEKDFESYTDAAKLKAGLEKTLEAEDGWVPRERWEQTQDLHKFAFEQMMAVTQEPDSDMAPDHMKAIWPYDIPC
ncbi:hypothetical protein MBLNU459_g5551t2 [Dothideomycetes sp. NU459]